MTIKTDRVTSNELRKIPTQKGQAEHLAQVFGNSRVFVIRQDTSPTAKFPMLTGVEKINITNTGALEIKAGAVSNFGVLATVNKFTAFDVSVGKSVLRVSGNGRFYQGTIGTTPDCDFVVPFKNFDPTNGLAFDESATLSAYMYRPSGTGTPAPDRTDDMAYSVEIYNHSQGGKVTLDCTLTIDTRDENVVFEDKDQARNIGDTAMYRTSQDVQWGKVGVGATLLISDKSNSESGLAPLQELIINFARNGAWVSYPFTTTYLRNLMTMTLPPFKAILRNRRGEILNIFQMHGGEAINDMALFSGNLAHGGRTEVRPLQPRFNCAMALFWESDRPALNDMYDTYMPGLDQFRESMCKNQSSFTETEPLITGGYGGNSLNGSNHMYYAGRWPEANVYKLINDPFLDDFMNSNGSSAYRAGWIKGYDGSEPGAYAGSNWYTSPGGPRPDRSVYPSVLALWLDNLNGVRTQDNVPYKDMAHGFYRGLYNHSNHFMNNASTMEGINKNDLLYDRVTAENTYYGNDPRSIGVSFNGDQRDGTGSWNMDIDGDMIMSGWARDPLHDHAQRGMFGMHVRSPAYALWGRFDTMSAMMLHQFPETGVRGQYMIRTMAWQWFQMLVAWKNATKHARGFSRAEMEAYWVRMLEGVYKYHYKPVHIDMEDSGYARGVRNLGIALRQHDNGYGWADPGGKLGYYMAWTLQLMKQTGLWHTLIAKNERCSLALHGLVRDMDTHCFGLMTQANGAVPGNYLYIPGWPSLDVIPVSWPAWYAEHLKDPVGDNDWIYRSGYNDDGSEYHRRYEPNQDIAWNHFEAYARMRKNFFPEIVHPLMDQAISEFDRYRADVTGRVNAAATPTEKRNMDYPFRSAGICPVKPPAPGKLRMQA